MSTSASTSPSITGPDYLITDEVAELLRTNPETVRYWRHKGVGPRSVKIGRHVLYRRADVEAFVTAAMDNDPVGGRARS